MQNNKKNDMIKDSVFDNFINFNKSKKKDPKPRLTVLEDYHIKKFNEKLEEGLRFYTAKVVESINKNESWENIDIGLYFNNRIRPILESVWSNGWDEGSNDVLSVINKNAKFNRVNNIVNFAETLDEKIEEDILDKSNELNRLSNDSKKEYSQSYLRYRFENITNSLNVDVKKNISNNVSKFISGRIIPSTKLDQYEYYPESLPRPIDDSSEKSNIKTIKSRKINLDQLYEIILKSIYKDKTTSNEEVENSNYHRVDLIIATELNAAYNIGTLNEMLKQGIKYVQWMNDREHYSRRVVCKMCVERTFTSSKSIKDAKPGMYTIEECLTNPNLMIPLHPFCKCRLEPLDFDVVENKYRLITPVTNPIDKVALLLPALITDAIMTDPNISPKIAKPENNTKFDININPSWINSESGALLGAGMFSALLFLFLKPQNILSKEGLKQVKNLSSRISTTYTVNPDKPINTDLQSQAKRKQKLYTPIQPILPENVNSGDILKDVINQDEKIISKSMDENHIKIKKHLRLHDVDEILEDEQIQILLDADQPTDYLGQPLPLANIPFKTSDKVPELVIVDNGAKLEIFNRDELRQNNKSVVLMNADVIELNDQELNIIQRSFNELSELTPDLIQTSKLSASYIPDNYLQRVRELQQQIDLVNSNYKIVKDNYKKQGSPIQRVNSQIVGVDKILSQLNESLLKIETNLNEKRLIIDDLYKQLQLLQTNIATNDKQIAVLTRNIEILNNKYGKLDEQLMRLTSNAGNNNELINKLNRQLEIINTDIQNYQLEIESLTEINRTNNTDIQTINSDLNNHRIEIKNSSNIRSNLLYTINTNNNNKQKLLNTLKTLENGEYVNSESINNIDRQFHNDTISYKRQLESLQRELYSRIQSQYQNQTVEYYKRALQNANTDEDKYEILSSVYKLINNTDTDINTGSLLNTQSELFSRITNLEREFLIIIHKKLLNINQKYKDGVIPHLLSVDNLEIVNTKLANSLLSKFQIRGINGYLSYFEDQLSNIRSVNSKLKELVDTYNTDIRVDNLQSISDNITNLYNNMLNVENSLSSISTTINKEMPKIDESIESLTQLLQDNERRFGRSYSSNVGSTISSIKSKIKSLIKNYQNSDSFKIFNNRRFNDPVNIFNIYNEQSYILHYVKNLPSDIFTDKLDVEFLRNLGYSDIDIQILQDIKYKLSKIEEIYNNYIILNNNLNKRLRYMSARSSAIDIERTLYKLDIKNRSFEIGKQSGINYQKYRKRLNDVLDFINPKKLEVVNTSLSDRIRRSKRTILINDLLELARSIYPDRTISIENIDNLNLTELYNKIYAKLNEVNFSNIYNIASFNNKLEYYKNNSLKEFVRSKLKTRFKFY